MDLIKHDPIDEEILILRELTKELWGYFSIEDKKKWWSIDDYFRFKSWSEKHNYCCRIAELPSKRIDLYFYSSINVEHGYYNNQYISVSKMEIEEFIDKTYPIVCSNFIYKMEEYIKDDICSIEYNISPSEHEWSYCYYDEDGNHKYNDSEKLLDYNDGYHKLYSDKNRAIALIKMSIDVIGDREIKHEK